MPRLSKIGAAALAAFGWTGISSVTASYLVVAGGGGGGSGESARAGGGGGAGGLSNGTPTAGGAGGKGIVIIRYVTGLITATGGTTSTSGGYTYHKFLSTANFQRTA